MILMYRVSIINADLHPLYNVSDAYVIIEDGLIKCVGGRDECGRYVHGSKYVIDAKGNTVLPGFIDSHIHLFKLGYSLKIADLRNVYSIEELKNRLREYGRRIERGWIIGRGWDHEKFSEGRMPNRFDLDDVSRDRPILIIRVCGHLAVVNSKALELAGIDKDAPDPPGGIIDRDSNGYPTGVLRENAVKLVYNALPKDTLEDYIGYGVYSINYLLRNGVTTVHHVSATPDELDALYRMSLSGLLKTRVRIYLDYRYINYISKYIRLFDGNPLVKVNGIKVIVDGSLGARTAALREPYYDDPNNLGSIIVSEDELRRVIRFSLENNLQLAIHGIGDRAIEYILDSIDVFKGDYEIIGRRFRIEHASLAPLDLIKWVSELGLCASVQPSFIISDFWALDRLGPDRIRWLYPFKTMIKHGICVGGGSDAPVEDPNPLYGVYSAVTRGCYEGIETCRYTSMEKLSLGEAIKLYTVNNAYLGFDDYIGGLTEGYYGDLIILDGNLNDTPDYMIKDVKVLYTILGGEIVYRKG